MVREIIRFRQRYKLRSQSGYGECQGLCQKLSSSGTEKSSIEDRYTILDELVQSKSSSDLLQMTTNLLVINLSDALTIDRKDQLEKVCLDHGHFRLLEYLIILIQQRFFRCQVLSESSHDQTSRANLEGFFQEVEIVELLYSFCLVLKFKQLWNFVNVAIWELEFCSFFSLFYELE